MEGFIGAIIFSLLLLFIGSGIVGIQSMKHSNKLIAECEAELPRNQSCVLIAVPEPQEGEG